MGQGWLWDACGQKIHKCTQRGSGAKKPEETAPGKGIHQQQRGGSMLVLSSSFPAFSISTPSRSCQCAGRTRGSKPEVAREPAKSSWEPVQWDAPVRDWWVHLERSCTAGYTEVTPPSGLMEVGSGLETAAEESRQAGRCSLVQEGWRRQPERRKGIRNNTKRCDKILAMDFRNRHMLSINLCVLERKGRKICSQDCKKPQNLVEQSCI